MFRSFLFLFLFLVVCDAFIWWNFTREESGYLSTFILLFPSVLTLLCALLQILKVRIAWLMQMTFTLFICVAIPKSVFLLTTLVGELVTWGNESFSRPIFFTAIALAVVMGLVQLYGTVRGWKLLKVKEMDMPLKGLPESFKGYRVVQISDLHLGTYGGITRYMRRLVDKINACNPDLIVFTGDLINSSSDEITPYLRILSRLRAKDGVCSILGNHDYCTFQPNMSAAEHYRHLKRVIHAEEIMGWRVMRNEFYEIKRNADSLYIIGVENIGKRPFTSRGNLKRAMKGMPAEACSILLSHDPWHWRHGVVDDTLIPLTLSGHTHAWQMQVGHFSPAQWFTKEWGGLYTKGEQFLYVSTGIGGSIPYRLGAWPQIEVFTLR